MKVSPVDVSPCGKVDNHMTQHTVNYKMADEKLCIVSHTEAAELELWSEGEGRPHGQD